MNVCIETKRLTLRNFNEGDLQNLFDLDSDPEVHKFLGNNPVKTLDESAIMLNSILKQYQDFGTGRLAIIEKETQAFIGWAGIKYEQQVRDFAYYDLGYRLKKQFWGKGYATEAATASLAHGFCTLNLEKIFAGADVDHIASNTILQKIGLHFIETFTFDNELCNWYGLKKDRYLNTITN